MKSKLKKATIALAVFVILIFSLLLFYQLWFLRMPVRIIPEGDGIVSPANGIVKEIIEIKNGEPIVIEKGLFGKVDLLTEDVVRDGYIIVIAMDVFSVHYQKAPLSGTIVKVEYQRGNFLNALTEGLEATFNNERNSITIETKIGKIKVVQIAGFVARRIESYVKEGQAVKKGDTIGLIKLGSQVALVIPELNLKIKKGDKVIEGQTVIAQ